MSGDKVLVMGDDTRSFLAIVRSLGRRGIAIHAAPSNFRSPALRSRYIAAIHYLPPWIGDGKEWLDATTQLLSAQRYSVVIPCNETALLPLQRYRKALSEFTRLAIPDDNAIALLFDKHETRQLAGRIGINIPPGRLIRADDTAEKVFSELGTPVVVKPRRSYALRTLGLRCKVHVVDDPICLQRLLDQSDAHETILEHYFPGQGIGVSVLANNGRLVQLFQHHRVREVDGASFYRCSALLNPDLAEACASVITALEYTGLAMFEFKRNPIGEWVLLEINARPWGSMPLPLALGVDFPYQWYRLLTIGTETEPVRYRPGVYGRNLVPDLRNCLLAAEANGRGPIALAWIGLQVFYEMRRIFIGREVNDVLVRDDPLPGLIELYEAAKAVIRKTTNRISRALSWRRYRAHTEVRRLKNAVSKPSIIFVCQGNICRSPFAEALVRANQSDSLVIVSSAGLMPQLGRPAPELAVEVGATHGVDLSAHRSVWLTRQMAESASLLIVFDEMIRQTIFSRYPKLQVPIILLGDLAGLGEIKDPIDGGALVFRRTYAQIQKSTTELISRLQLELPRFEN